MVKSLSLLDYPKRDLSRAQKSCRNVLKKRISKLPLLSPNCLISIIVPVYNEIPKRLKKQIKAFESQTLPKDNFEIIFVINNSKNPPKQILRNNQTALTFLKKTKSQIPIIILDRSMPGQEIKDCNVGRARNFGLHLVAQRYLLQNRDGITLQTDSDTTPIDKNYLKKMVTVFSDKKFFGASGGLKNVLDPDTKNKKTRNFYLKNIQIFRHYFQWLCLVSALCRKDPKIIMNPTRFSGAHMISRAVAAICAGGIPEVNRAEDTIFGKNLENYAKSRKAKIFPGREFWFLQTAIRESSRTESSLNHIFQNIKSHNGHPLVINPDAPIIYEFFKDVLIYLKKTKLINRKDFFSYPNPITPPSDQEFLELKKLKTKIENKKGRESLYKAYEDYCQSQKKSSLPNYLRKIKKDLYPPVPLTDAAIEKLKTLVYKDPERKAYAKNAMKYFAQLNLPK